MKYISPKEAAAKWGVSQRRVNTLCAEGRIEGAVRYSRVWLIPEEAEKPTDSYKIRPIHKKRSGISDSRRWNCRKGT